MLKNGIKNKLRQIKRNKKAQAVGKALKKQIKDRLRLVKPNNETQGVSKELQEKNSVDHKIKFKEAVNLLNVGEFKKAAEIIQNLVEHDEYKKIIPKIIAHFLESERALHNIRSHARHFEPLESLYNESCYSCDSKKLDFAPYPPHDSKYFASLQLVRCTECQLSWVPFLHFDLADYYKEEYANTSQTFRTYDGKFYSDKNPFWRGKIVNRFLARADFHINLAKKHTGKESFDKVLDLGSGMGITLSKIDSKQKHACEPDTFCQKILKSELGVEMRTMDEMDRDYDVIISSHSLEHLFIKDVQPLLDKVASSLKPDGVFVLEVPNGASKIRGIENGKLPTSRIEPHTINFSSISLTNMLKKSNLMPLELNMCGMTKSLFNQDEFRSRFKTNPTISEHTSTFVVAKVV